MEEITKFLGDFYGVFVEARGRAGGLALLWDKRTDLTVMSYSSHHIDSTIKWHTQNPRGDSRGYMGGQRLNKNIALGS